MVDMTLGAPRSHLTRFALPLVLGNWLQLSYNAVDTIIAGRFIGQDALAAEGIAGPVMNLLILAVSGMCIGAGVLMSEAFGAKDFPRVQRVLANTLSVGFCLCCLLALLGVLLARPILSFLAVPEEIFDITLLYLRIIFLGTPFTFCYNALSAGLKSVGDTDTPLKFLAFSALLNAGLDILFLGVLGFGILCSAMTTVIAEGVCAFLALLYMLKRIPELTPKSGQWRPEKQILRQILAYGGPTALQQAIQPVCKVLIQSQVNALGVSAIAAFNAVSRIDDFACIPAQSISSTISTFIAQNRGAQKPERIRTGFRAGIRLEACYWLVIGSLTALLRRPMVGLFVTGEGAEEVIALGTAYLGWMILFYLWPTMTNGFQGFFRGMGMMKTTMLATFLQASLRTLCTCFLAPYLGITGIAFSCAIGWTAMLILEVPYFFIVCKRKGY